MWAGTKCGMFVECYSAKEHRKRVIPYAEPVVQDELTRVDELPSWITVASLRSHPALVPSTSSKVSS